MMFTVQSTHKKQACSPDLLGSFFALVPLYVWDKAPIEHGISHNKKIQLKPISLL